MELIILAGSWANLNGTLGAVLPAAATVVAAWITAKSVNKDK
ncbi:hypothetical protein [Thalassobacillus sp. B23F22_16]